MFVPNLSSLIGKETVELYNRIHSQIPEGQEKIYEAAYRILCVSRELELLLQSPPPDVKPGDPMTWFMGGHAERLICAVESFCRAFGYEGIGKDGNPVPRISDAVRFIEDVGLFYEQNGLRTTRQLLGLTLKLSNRLHSSALARRSAIIGAKQETSQSKGKSQS